MDADSALQQIRRIAAAFLRGELLPIEAAIACPFVELEDAPPALQDALNTIKVVSSDTDDIPLGSRRELWHPDVRKDEDAKHDQAQAWARPLLEEAFRKILDVVPASVGD